MNKKLLMAAVGAALIAGPMVAANAAATLYGRMHVSLDRLDNDAGNEDGRVSSNTSIFGFKGDEDLGGGLKAIYQVESGTFLADTGTVGFGDTLRNTFVGFTGSWGAVKVGRHNTPYKELGTRMDNFRHQIGDNRIIIGDGGTFDKRVSNMIRYDSPSFSGWNVSAQNTSNDGAEATASVHKNSSLAVTWSAGPLFLGLGWEEQGTATTSDASGNRLVGSYTFNDITLGLLWDTLSDIGGTSGHDRDVLGLFASMKMGNNKFKFHWLDADKYDDLADTGGSVWALGVDHSFSKTAMIYFNYVSVDNDTAATFNTTSPSGHGDTLATTAGKSPTAYSLGTVIKF